MTIDKDNPNADQINLADPFYALQRAKEVLSGSKKIIWEQIPVPFDEFVEDKKHLNFVPLSERQYDFCFALLYGITYKDYKKGKEKLNFNIFENMTYTLAVAEVGKGSGKDTVAACIVCYICYVLLCLKDPQSQLNAPYREPIDVVNVARSAQQAEVVFFAKLQTRILNWQWLRKNYSIKKSGKAYSLTEKKSNYESMTENEVVVNTNAILFPKAIRLFSRHSMEESYEGLNPIAWIMDEACLRWNTAITDVETKVTRSIQDWAESRKGVLLRTYNQKTRKVETERSGIPFYKGIADIYKVTTATGKTIEVTAKHRFLVKENERIIWKPLEEISEGDSIFCREVS
jgi:hypothetical protein